MNNMKKYKVNYEEITLKWIRHAESCGNLYDKNISDNYDKKLHEKFNQQIDKYINDDNLISPNQLFHPPLSYVGIKQSEQLGDFLCNCNENSIFLCSATVRTITTALISLSKCNLNKIEIIICPFINEIFNDIANNGLPVNKLNSIIKLIKETIHVKHNIIINTSIYEKFSKYENYKLSNEKLFFQQILPLFTQQCNYKTNIIIFSHGCFIDKIGKLCNKNLNLIPNTSIFQHKYDIKTKTFSNHDFDILYQPNSIRKNKNDILENDKNNYCSLKGLRGQIHKILTDN